MAISETLSDARVESALRLSRPLPAPLVPVQVDPPTQKDATGGQATGQQATGRRATVEQLWAWLGEVPDPEIPAVSVVDLGIVRDVCWSDDTAGTARVTVTPTYSGCPATDVIGHQIRAKLQEHGVAVDLRVQLSPAWTTDWLTDKARQNLKEYGIAPPAEQAVSAGNALSASLVVLGQGAHKPRLECPRCGSTNNEMVSRFGSTPCKSLHRCLDCMEPFDHFKCH